MKILETERLSLRHVNTDDAEFILALLNEPAYIQNIGDRGIRTLEQAKKYILDRLISSYEKHGFGLYLVELKKTGEATGICGLVKREGLDDVDVGYGFLPTFWGKGYATESVLALKKYAKNAVGLKRVAGIVAPDNQGSIRVLEKAGLMYEKMVKLSEDDIDLKLYAAEI